MNSKRPNVMKSTARAGAGGAVVIAAVLALIFLRGGAGTPGTGADENSPGDQTSMASTQGEAPSTDVVPNSTPAETDARAGLTPDEEHALSNKVLSILVDERSYLMEVPTDNEPLYRPADLTRLLEVAKMAEGDSNGIRIRILQRETARVSAKHELEAGLAKIGIGTDGIYTQQEFIP